jgi:hypothetical protein
VIVDVARARIAAEKVPPRRRRFHWKSEEDAQRYDMLAVLLDLECRLWTYECRPCPTNKQERGRAKCLEAMLWDLKDLGVEQLVLESRGAAADRRDDRTIGHAIRCGRASRNLVHEHRRPSVESALWLADAVASATGHAFEGRTAYRDRLGDNLHRCLVTL